MSKFNILYSGDQIHDAVTLCEYVDEFYHTLGVGTCEIDISKVLGVLQSLQQDFPSPLGIGKSSPFKKVAAFTVNFAADRPIYTPLPVASFGQLATHQNAILAISLSIDALEQAVIKCSMRGDILLKNRIHLSTHYWKDLVAALSFCVPSQHFELLSLIYESLVYEANPGVVSYDKVI